MIIKQKQVLKIFLTLEKKLSNYIMILLKLYLKLCIKKKHGKGVKILIPKQILQRLPIALTQVKAGNSSENVLYEIRQIVHSLFQSKEITKKVYNNIIK